MLDLNEIAKKSYEIAERRYRNGAFGTSQNSVQNLLKHCAGEVVEAMSAYSDWQEDVKFGAVSMGVTDPDWNRCTPKEAYISELADIICCVLIIAGKQDIDIEKALLDCYAKNLARANGTGDKK